MKIGILGIGKIGESVLKQIPKKYEIIIYTTNEECRKKYEGKYPIAKDEENLFSLVDYLFIAVKPQTIISILDNKTYMYKNKCVVSFCAGIKLDYFEQKFIGSEVVRLMPNTAISLGSSMTTVSTNNLKRYKDITGEILEAFGSYSFVNEDDLDKLMPLNGSMPAFIYTFTKYFIEIAKEYGILKEEAAFVIAKTLISSGEMILENNNVEELIKNVSSKGGTTLAGLSKLDNDCFKESIYECYKACYERNKELSK